MASDYLKPKVSSPKKLRDKTNGQFKNPPLYVDRWGGFTGPDKLHRGTTSNMQLERGGPSAKRGKPI